MKYNFFVSVHVEIERIEIGQSIEDGQQLSEELSSNSNQQQPPVEDILLDNVTYHADAPDNGNHIIVVVIRTAYYSFIRMILFF